jgi:hypothetical protein
MSVRIVDHSATLKQALYAHLADNLGAGAELLRTEVQANIGIQGPPRSVPGEFPHRDSGDLQESIFDDMDPDSLTARVGSTMPYAPTLEDHMDRAYFVPTLIEHADEIGTRIAKS